MPSIHWRSRSAWHGPLGEFDRRLRAGETLDRSNHLGVGFWNKTVGIVDMGNIGSLAARKWHGAFDATIPAYDPYAPPHAWSDLPHKRVDSLDELLPAVDLLSLHVPLTPETRNLIGAAELSRMKPTAILINVSRGGIVDEKALHRAIIAGEIFGAHWSVQGARTTRTSRCCWTTASAASCSRRQQR